MKIIAVATLALSAHLAGHANIDPTPHNDPVKAAPTARATPTVAPTPTPTATPKPSPTPSPFPFRSNAPAPTFTGGQCTVQPGQTACITITIH